MDELTLGSTTIRRVPLGSATVAWHAGIWLAYGVVRFTAGSWGYAASEMPVMAAATLIRVGTGFVVAFALGAVLRRMGTRRHRHVIVARVVAAAVPAAMVWYVLDRTLLIVLAVLMGIAIPWHNWPHGLEVEYALVMVMWSVAYVAFHLWASSRDLERQLLATALEARDAQVRALGWQINPHFLFNTLNAVRSLVAEDTERARSVITQLSRLLRYALQAPDGGLVPLAAELEAVRSYVAIQQARFEQPIDVTFTVGDGARHCPIPVFLLQPLVENALEHGSPALDSRRRVRVEANVVGQRLVIVVTNRGALGPTGGSGAGVGLSNVFQRLEAIFGDAARFELREHNGEVQATVTVPVTMARRE